MTHLQVKRCWVYYGDTATATNHYHYLLYYKVTLQILLLSSFCMVTLSIHECISISSCREALEVLMVVVMINIFAFYDYPFLFFYILTLWIYYRFQWIMIEWNLIITKLMPHKKKLLVSQVWYGYPTDW